MSARHFKGKDCAYCGSPAFSEGPDHIFARAFFPVEERGNLPRVPACRTCNGEKAALENYLVAVLPFGGEHQSSHAVLTRDVSRRLDGNQKLRKELAEGQSRIWVDWGKLTLPSLALPFDPDRLTELFGFIARGLAAYHWNLVMPATYVARAGMFVPEAERMMEQLFRLRSAAHVQGRLGKDTILYEGVQAHDDPCLTIWRFRLYGGTLFVDDSGPRPEGTSNIWATTSRSGAPDIFNFEGLVNRHPPRSRYASI